MMQSVAGRTITVDNRVRVPLASVTRDELALIERAFTYPNPDHAKWRHLKLRSKPPPQEITTCVVSDGVVSVPRGGLGRVERILGLDRSSVARRTTEGMPGGRNVPPHSLPNGGSLWPFQEQMIQHAVEHEVCCLRAPPAAGKTTAALALASRLNLPTLVIVWTGALLKQWVDRCAAELDLHGDEVGIIQGDERRVRPITIGMQQTLVNCVGHYIHVFGLVIVDECQRAAAETYTHVIDQCPARYRVGVSADERRADGKEFLIYDSFGDVAFEVGRDELEEAGRIVDVEVRVVPTDFDAPWYRALVRQSRYGSKQKLALAFNRVLQEMTTDAARNQVITDVVAGHAAAGQLVVALSHRREHCSVLSAEFDRATGGRGGLLLGGTGNEAEYDRAKSGLKSGRVRAAAATYQAFGTGMDVPGLEVGVFATPVANSKKARMQFDQYRGRFARAHAGKESAVAYYVWDRLLYGAKPLKNLASWCKRVTVRHDGRWVPVKEFLKTTREDAQAQRSTETAAAETGGLFYDPRQGSGVGTSGGPTNQHESGEHEISVPGGRRLRSRLGIKS